MLKTGYYHRCNAASFLTAFTTLTAQILVFRIISSKLYNNYAFLVISLTMLGFATSGVILAYNYRIIKNLRSSVRSFSYCLVFSLILSTVIFYRLPVDFALSGDWTSCIKPSLYLVLIACLFVLPFIFCGLILGILLSHQRLPTCKIYCFDLVGSALGALSVVGLITFFGVEKSLLVIICFFLLGVHILYPVKILRERWMLRFVLLLALIIFANSTKVFQVIYPVRTLLSVLEPEYDQWDPVGRITVSHIDVLNNSTLNFDMSMIGPDQEFQKRIKKFLSQNNNAGTWAFHYDGNLESLKGIQGTLYFGAYQARVYDLPNVLVIGVGAGMDVLAALYGQAGEITGVEINGATHDILNVVYEDYFQHWVRDSRVHLIHDEGRHYLSKTQEHFDVIQLTGVDTYSGTMASANIFSENYLYTKEALQLYWDRLTDKGLINIIRLEHPATPREMVRMLTTTVEVLRDNGIREPSRHVVMMANEWLTGAALLISKRPFEPQELRRLKDWAETNPYFRFNSTPELPPGPQRTYQSFLELNSEKLEEDFIRNYPFNVRPTKDDKPFFFHYTTWKHFLEKRLAVFEYNIFFLLTLLSVISMVLIFLPLKYLLRSSAPLPQKYRYALVFICLGIGYFFIEIAFMQKLGLFLGHPNYAISVVLSGLLFSTGLGSITSRKIIQKIGGIGRAVVILIALVLAEYALLFPNVSKWVGQDMVLKCALAVLLLSPVGFILGIFMPEVLERLKRSSPQYVPWGWGINGIFSVIAPVLAIAISQSFGISMLLLCSIPFYALVGYLLPKLH